MEEETPHLSYFPPGRLETFAVEYGRIPLLWLTTHGKHNQKYARAAAYTRLAAAMGEPRGKGVAGRMARLCRQFLRRLHQEYMIACAEAARRGDAARDDCEFVRSLLPSWAVHADGYLNLLPQILAPQDKPGENNKLVIGGALAPPWMRLSAGADRLHAEAGFGGAMRARRVLRELRCAARGAAGGAAGGGGGGAGGLRAAAAVAARRLGDPARVVYDNWVHLRTAAVRKLRELVRRGDEVGAMPVGCRLSAIDWAAADLAVYYGHSVLHEEHYQRYSSLSALLATFHLVQRHGLEPAPGAAPPAPRAWRRAAAAYCASGRAASTVVLQRRWHELKEAARRALRAAWRAPADPGAAPPPPLLQAIARRYPHVVTGAPEPWARLVQERRVAGPTLACGPAPGEKKPNGTPDANDSTDDDDLILVENKIDTIVLDGDDTDQPKSAAALPQSKDMPSIDQVDNLLNKAFNALVGNQDCEGTDKLIDVDKEITDVDPGSDKDMVEALRELDVSAVEMMIQFDDDDDFNDKELNADDQSNINKESQACHETSEVFAGTKVDEPSNRNVVLGAKGAGEALKNMSKCNETANITEHQRVLQIRDIISTEVESYVNKSPTSVITDQVSESNSFNIQAGQRSRSESCDSEMGNLIIDHDYEKVNIDVEENGFKQIDYNYDAAGVDKHNSNPKSDPTEDTPSANDDATKLDDARGDFNTETISTFENDDVMTACSLKSNGDLPTSENDDATVSEKHNVNLKNDFLTGVIVSSKDDHVTNLDDHNLDTKSKFITEIVQTSGDDNAIIADKLDLNPKIDFINKLVVVTEINSDKLDTKPKRDILPKVVQSWKSDDATVTGLKSKSDLLTGALQTMDLDDVTDVDKLVVEPKNEFITGVIETTHINDAMNEDQNKIKLNSNFLTTPIPTSDEDANRLEYNLKPNSDFLTNSIPTSSEDVGVSDVQKFDLKPKSDIFAGLEQTLDNDHPINKDKHDLIPKSEDFTEVVQTVHSNDSTKHDSNPKSDVLTEITQEDNDDAIAQDKHALKSKKYRLTEVIPTSDCNAVANTEQHDINSKRDFHTGVVHEMFVQNSNSVDSNEFSAENGSIHEKSAPGHASSTKSNKGAAGRIHSSIETDSGSSKSNDGCESNDGSTKSSGNIIEIDEPNESSETIAENTAASTQRNEKENPPTANNIVGGHAIRNPILLQLLRSQPNDLKRWKHFAAINTSIRPVAANSNENLENVTKSNSNISNDLMDTENDLRDSGDSSVELDEGDTSGEIDPKLIMYPVVVLTRLDLPRMQRRRRQIRRISLFDPTLSPKFVFKKENMALLRLCRPCVVLLERLKLRALPAGGRVAKRVELPDIEQVRRDNRKILTAQVAPITVEVDESEARRARGERVARGTRGAGAGDAGAGADDAGPSADDLRELLDNLAQAAWECMGRTCVGCPGCAARRLARPAPGRVAASVQRRLLRYAAERARRAPPKNQPEKPRDEVKKQRHRDRKRNERPARSPSPYDPELAHRQWLREKNIAAEKFGIKPRSYKKKATTEQPSEPATIEQLGGALTSEQQLDTLHNNSTTTQQLEQVPSGSYVVNNDGSIFSISAVPGRTPELTITPTQTNSQNTHVVLNQTPSSTFHPLTEENLLQRVENQPSFRLDSNLFNRTAVADLNKKLGHLAADAPAPAPADASELFRPVIINVQSLAQNVPPPAKKRENCLSRKNIMDEIISSMVTVRPPHPQPSTSRASGSSKARGMRRPYDKANRVVSLKTTNLINKNYIKASNVDGRSTTQKTSTTKPRAKSVPSCPEECVKFIIKPANQGENNKNYQTQAVKKSFQVGQGDQRVLNPPEQARSVLIAASPPADEVSQARSAMQAGAGISIFKKAHTDIIRTHANTQNPELSMLPSKTPMRSSWSINSVQAGTSQPNSVVQRNQTDPELTFLLTSEHVIQTNRQVPALHTNLQPEVTIQTSAGGNPQAGPLLINQQNQVSLTNPQFNQPVVKQASQQAIPFQSPHISQAGSQLNSILDVSITPQNSVMEPNSQYGILMIDHQTNALQVNAVQAGPPQANLLVGPPSFVPQTNPHLGVLSGQQTMPLNSVQAGPSLANSMLVGLAQDYAPQLTSFQAGPPQVTGDPSETRQDVTKDKKKGSCGSDFFDGRVVDPSSLPSMSAAQYVRERDPTALVVLAGALPARRHLLLREAAAGAGPVLGLQPPCRLLEDEDDNAPTPPKVQKIAPIPGTTPDKDTVINLDEDDEPAKKLPWLKVKSFAKMSDDSSPGQAQSIPEAVAELNSSGGKLLAPRQVFLQDKVYHKLCNEPLTYAKVLAAVASAREVRALVSRRAPLFAYSLDTYRLHLVHGELTPDGSNLLLSGPSEISDLLHELAVVLAPRSSPPPAAPAAPAPAASLAPADPLPPAAPLARAPAAARAAPASRAARPARAAPAPAYARALKQFNHLMLGRQIVRPTKEKEQRKPPNKLLVQTPKVLNREIEARARGGRDTQTYSLVLGQAAVIDLDSEDD